MSTRPTFFGERFGWLHQADGALGVVLCAPFGHEAIWAHAGTRKLAESLAAAGMPTLRFDYRGDGDSGDLAADTNRCETCIEDILAAVAHLRATTGVERVALCGIRLGATLAVLAAQRLGAMKQQIDALVMLAPVTRGRTYLRELSALQHAFLEVAGPYVRGTQETGEHVEALGHRIAFETVRALTELELGDSNTAPAPHLLILSPGLRATELALCKHYRACGAQVELEDFSERDNFLRDAVYSETPRQAIAKVVTWLGEAAARDAAPRRRRTHGAIRRMPSLRLSAASEEPVFIGKRRVFGMLSAPHGPQEDHPAVVFVNTGRTHHVGAARLAVTFARRFAHSGITSLRIDVGGIGDSDPENRSGESPLYADAAREDVGAAVDWLAQLGHRRVVVFGICSGAYLALHAALENSHIAGLCLVNLEWFFRPAALQQRDTPAPVKPASTRQYLLSLRRADKWAKVFKGETRLLPIAKVFLQLGWKRLRLRAGRGARKALSEPERILDLLHRLEKRGVHTQLYFGALDAGLDELESHFGRHGSRLPLGRHLQCTVLEALDHALFSTPGRTQLASLMHKFLQQDMSPGGAREPAVTQACNATAAPGL